MGGRGRHSGVSVNRTLRYTAHKGVTARKPTPLHTHTHTSRERRKVSTDRSWQRIVDPCAESSVLATCTCLHPCDCDSSSCLHICAVLPCAVLFCAVPCHVCRYMTWRPATWRAAIPTQMHSQVGCSVCFWHLHLLAMPLLSWRAWLDVT
jgi:hypothetical protein